MTLHREKGSGEGREVLATIALLVICLFSAYQCIHVLATGDFHQQPTGKHAPGAIFINFLGDHAGPIGVSVFYAIFALIMAFFLYKKVWKS